MMTLRLPPGLASWIATAAVGMSCVSCAGILGLDSGLPEDDAGPDAAAPPAFRGDAAAGGDRGATPTESGVPFPVDGSQDDGGDPFDHGAVPPPDAVTVDDAPAELDASPEDATTTDATTADDAPAERATEEDAPAQDTTPEDATQDAARQDATADAAKDATDATDAERPPHDAAADRLPPVDACPTLECTAGGCCDPVANGVLVCNGNGTCGHICSQGYVDCGGIACSCGGAGNVCLSNGSTGTCGACRKALGACEQDTDCCGGTCTLNLTCL
jgi:hypothetical protein